MDAPRERRLADLLLAAFERPAGEQHAFLEEACGDDPELLEEALACLAGEGELGGFLEGLAGAELMGSWEGGGAPEGAGLSDRDPPHRNLADRTLADGPFGRGRAVRAAAAEPPSETSRDGGTPGGPTAGPATAMPETWRTTLGRDRLGAYRIFGLLGEGGMGQVFLGEDERLGRQVAVKILPPALATREDGLKRFEREARALAALNHPNIVTIHSIEEVEGEAGGKEGTVRFLTMERVAGRTLKERIAEGALGVGEVLGMGLELSDALAAAHRQGVVHRDLKPANVMITGDGRVKIVDFGIATLTSGGTSDLTRDRLIGTVSYMAPEQLEGRRADERTDLFALGVILYQMATGEHPFAAESTAVQIRAILDREPQDPRALRPDLPQELGRIIGRCLDKVPARRFAGAEELRRDLAALQEDRMAERILRIRTATAAASPPLPKAGAGRRRSLVAAALLVAAVSALALVLWTRGAFSGDPGAARAAAGEAVAAGAPETTNLAVFPFQDLTADPRLAWLADGIAELLITDLAQSPGLVVFSRAEVQRLLSEIGGGPEGGAGAEEVRALADKGDLEVVVRGSFARAGEVLRISYVLEDPLGGRVLRSASFEGRGEESLFGLVDQLGAKVLETVGASRPELSPASVEDATTSSLLAWQAYIEAQGLYLEESKTEEAIGRLEEALAIDPDFALAAVAAAKMHQSLGRGERAQAYSRQAFEGVDRLPLRVRFNVEAGYYGTRWATLGRSIETFALALKVYPDSPGWRNNLARRYAFFERYHEAMEEFRRAMGSGAGFWGDVAGAATIHAAAGEFAAGHELLAEALAEHPGHWLLGYAAAWHLTEWGRYEDAAVAFDELAKRRPDTTRIPYGRWRLALLQDDWAAADRQARRLLEIDDSFARWRGNVALAENALYRGRAQEALIRFDDAVAASAGADRALARCFKAELQLTLGDAAGAREEAERARAEGAEQWPELRGIFLAARAEEALGRPAAADRLLEELRNRWRRQPNAVEERQIFHLSGLLALARGHAKAGRDDLERAAALLPPRGVEFSWHVFPHHVPLWVDLGEAELALGRSREASAWLSRARGAGAERLERPVPYVRGLFLEAQALKTARQGTGAAAQARRRLKEFLAYWGGGELARDWQAEARRQLGRTP